MKYIRFVSLRQVDQDSADPDQRAPERGLHLGLRCLKYSQKEDGKAERIKMTRNIATTQPERLIKCYVSDDRFKAEVLLPGLWYTDFDKKIGGKLSYSAMLKLYESIRFDVFKEGFIHFYDLFGKNSMIFLASASYRFSENINNITYQTHFGKKFPLHGKTWLVQVGQSSFCIATEIFDMQGQFLSEQITKLVCIDRATRKPIAVPRYLIEKFQTPSQNPQYNINKVRPPAIPSSSFKLVFHVLHSDCDANMHANHANFLKWCSDAAAEAARAGCFSYFKRHPELYPLKVAEMHYLGEVLVNTEVAANVWEDELDLKCLRATVSNKGKIVFHTVLEYSDKLPVKVEPHLESKL